MSQSDLKGIVHLVVALLRKGMFLKSLTYLNIYFLLVYLENVLFLFFDTLTQVKANVEKTNKTKTVSSLTLGKVRENSAYH